MPRKTYVAVFALLAVALVVPLTAQSSIDRAIAMKFYPAALDGDFEATHAPGKPVTRIVTPLRVDLDNSGCGGRHREDSSSQLLDSFFPMSVHDRVRHQSLRIQLGQIPASSRHPVLAAARVRGDVAATIDFRSLHQYVSRPTGGEDGQWSGAVLIDPVQVKGSSCHGEAMLPSSRCSLLLYRCSQTLPLIARLR